MTYMRWLNNESPDTLTADVLRASLPTTMNTGASLTPALRVLVVEDNIDVADTLAALIVAWGHTTRIARDAIAGLNAADEFKPHVVLLDIGLPRMHGYDVARRLRERPWGRDLMVIAVTGWGQDADRLQSQGAGINHHLVKPVEPDALQRILSGVSIGES